jgi:hypothetical protein
MKKGRPAVVLTVLCPPGLTGVLSRTIFQHTTTLGIRSYQTVRRTLDRHIAKIETDWGSVRVKVSRFEGQDRAKPEYEDCLRISREHHLPLWKVYRDVLRTWERDSGDHRSDRGGRG